MSTISKRPGVGSASPVERVVEKRNDTPRALKPVNAPADHLRQDAAASTVAANRVRASADSRAQALRGGLETSLQDKDRPAPDISLDDES